MFQHHSLGIRINIQVTKLVLLRQRPVSPLWPFPETVTGLEASSLMLATEEASRGLSVLSALPGFAHGDSVPWAGDQGCR